MQTRFEQHIKNSLENFEAEYNPADWSDLKNRLSKANAGKPSNIGKGLMIAASVIAISGAIYYFSASGTANIDNPVKKTQNVIAKDANKNPVQQVEIKDKQASVKNENNEKESAPVLNNTSEQKTISSEKSEKPVVVNTIENKTSVQEQRQNPAEQLPASNVSVLSAAFRADINKICEGSPVQFIADKNDAPCAYKWYFGDGESSAEQNPRHTFAEAGTYTVKLRVISVQDKKQIEQKNSVTVAAAPSVQMNYSVSEDNSLLINFEADADKEVDWKWDFGDRQIASVQNPAHTYSKRGNYKVIVTAKNSAGCSVVINREVNLKLDLLAPNAFSPDGNGVNDTWMPVALLKGDYLFTLTISDKTENVVFETSDKNRSWDGQNAKAGDTFIWRVVVKDKNGDETIDQGLITISE
ncbi:MAG: PKD domain-containing protein [Bacteroidetes bacterium]|nr:MAG: PKD domain-containing protein [Bacteroidota bacterium]